MNVFELSAEARDLQGKGASRRLRRAGKIPAIVYGGDREPAAIQVDHNDVLRRSEHEAFYSHILTLNMGAGAERVVLKDMQRHPYRPLVIHMDFQRINENEELEMRVPIHFVNEENCIGVKQSGGVISHMMSDVEIVCLPKDLPEYITVDLANMDVGDTLHLSELAMPAGVRAAVLVHHGDASQPVVSVHAPRVAAEGEGATPAAPGATPAA
jgi:large subunit ribosomal protein L25